MLFPGNNINIWRPIGNLSTETILKYSKELCLIHFLFEYQKFFMADIDLKLRNNGRVIKYILARRNNLGTRIIRELSIRGVTAMAGITSTHLFDRLHRDNISRISELESIVESNIIDSFDVLNDIGVVEILISIQGLIQIILDSHLFYNQIMASHLEELTAILEELLDNNMRPTNRQINRYIVRLFVIFDYYRSRDLIDLE